ncbi:MAG: ABC transporter substrate-binding protein [Rhodospirillaceae bacterium]|nr:ABC transporter substrate-binding protein [Rhodospirillaceae bacterium]
MTSRRDLLTLIGRNAAGLAAASALAPSLARAESAEPEIYKGHGMAMHGSAKYKAGFAHFDYVNAKAPKGGSLYYGVGGSTFDNLNPFILKGTPAAYAATVFETLMVSSSDEPFSKYGLVAKTIETPKDRAWVAFEVDERARFHDGSPITADDVVFSFETLVSEKSHPRYRQYYHDVVKVEKTDARRVKFTFRAAGNRELPLILGELPVLSEAFWSKRKFDEVTLDPPLGSGPYKVGDVSPGRYIAFERVKDYWGKDLPVMQGSANFDLIRLDYFRDATVAREAFKAGEFDYHNENQALAWATQYDIPAVRDGLLIKNPVPHRRPAGMQCFVMNTRRPMFSDWRVRRALTLMFDFEWTNKNLFFGQYTRCKSYFSNSEMEATGLPQGEELKILERFRGRVPDAVFTQPYTLPVYSGDGNIREGAREAVRLLREAGWDFKGTDLVETKTGNPLHFQMMTASQAFERIYQPYIANLRRIGVKAEVRLVDPVQYQKRVETFDFDMITEVFGESESPGNEQRQYWSSAAAKTPGSDNITGIADKVVDELIDLIVSAPDREGLVARCKALDRVLLNHHLVVPSWYLAVDRLIYWDKFGLPPPHRRGTSPTIWWLDAAKAQRLKGRIRSLP